MHRKEILEIRAICLKSIIRYSYHEYIEEMYSKLDINQEPFEDHNKMIRTKNMVICEMVTEYILQYINKIKIIKN